MAIEKQVVREGTSKDFIPDAVRVGDTIYASGQVSLGSDGQVVASGDLSGQLRQAYGADPEVSQTFVQVGGLVFPALMIEIKCIARL